MLLQSGRPFLIAVVAFAGSNASGSNWDREFLFEGFVPVESKVKYPLCLVGARACPPDDCGGVWGYAEFVEAIQNPDTP
jgi:Plasmid pRiA4b ORF-3-like protein